MARTLSLLFALPGGVGVLFAVSTGGGRVLIFVPFLVASQTRETIVIFALNRRAVLPKTGVIPISLHSPQCDLDVHVVPFFRGAPWSSISASRVLGELNVPVYIRRDHFRRCSCSMFQNRDEKLTPLLLPLILSRFAQCYPCVSNIAFACRKSLAGC